MWFTIRIRGLRGEVLWYVTRDGRGLIYLSSAQIYAMQARCNMRVTLHVRTKDLRVGHQSPAQCLEPSKTARLKIVLVTHR